MFLLLGVSALGALAPWGPYDPLWYVEAIPIWFLRVAMFIATYMIKLAVVMRCYTVIYVMFGRLVALDGRGQADETCVRLP